MFVEYIVQIFYTIFKKSILVNILYLKIGYSIRKWAGVLINRVRTANNIRFTIKDMEASEVES